MCSVYNDETCESFVEQEKPILSDTTKCRSCTNQAVVVLRRKDVYCKKCFLAAETHKFRADLGKSKLMKPHDHVLVAFSGSQASVALLHLLHSGMNENHHKKLFFRVSVLFIDEGAVLNMAVEERMKIAENVKEKIESYGFQVYFISLSESLSSSCVIPSFLEIDYRNDVFLLKLFENIQSMSSKEDLLYLLKHNLIMKVSKKLNCNKVFTSEVGTDLAIKLLTAFSSGRGDQASFAFLDSRLPDVKLLRPLRGFTKKEIVFYNRFYSLEHIQISTLTTKSTSNISIKKLTEKFITDLQEKFPSTIYTIFRTGEKLSIDSGEKKMQACLLCKDKIRTNFAKNNYSAVDAANFSMNASKKKLSDCASNENSCCRSCSGKLPKILIDDLKRFLCYGCALVIRDMKSLSDLPNEFIYSAIQSQNFAAMKEEISEFLIDQKSEL